MKPKKKEAEKKANIQTKVFKIVGTAPYVQRKWRAK